MTVKQTSVQAVLVSWLPGHNGGADCTFTVKYKTSDSQVWTTSHGILGNATSTVLINKDGWNGLFVFRVTAVNQFGSCESIEVPVTLKGINGNLLFCQQSFIDLYHKWWA